MSRRLSTILVAFGATRIVLAFLAGNPDVYGSSYAQVTTDIALYEGWAFDMVAQDKMPYSSFPMEYPPASVPFVAVPAADQTSAESYDEGVYVPRFIALMLLVDIAGLAGLLVLARRWGTDLGVWVWIAALFLLGPIVYARLDLVPAVATIWAIERASAGSWSSSGGWLGFGTLAKVYPVFLAPIAFIVAPRRKQVAIGFAVVAVLLLVPHVANLGDLYGSVVSFHARRGVHVESLWGTILVFASKLGLDSSIDLSYGAFHVESALTPFFKAAAGLAAFAALFVGCRAAQRLPRGDAAGTAVVMFGTLALMLGVGSVFSPQFLIWLIALGAAAACFSNETFRSSVTLILPIALATQVVYPFIYHHVVEGNAFAILFVACRDLLVIVAGIGALLSVRSGRARLPDAEPSGAMSGAVPVAAD